MRKNVIRIGDKVKIVNPMIFVRCGYPYTKQIVKDTVMTKEQKDAITDLLRTKFNIYSTSLSFGNYTPDNSDDTYDKIEDIIAYRMLEQLGWGGKERSIYDTNVPTLKDHLCQVVGKRVVKTGKYYPGRGGSYDYWGEYDYEPSYLENEKAHVILKLCSMSGVVIIDNILQTEFEIHQQHVIKLGECSLDERFIRSYD